VELTPAYPIRHTIRNTNLLRAGLTFLLFGGPLLVVAAVSSVDPGGIVWALALILVGVGALYLASWRRVTLDVLRDGVRLGGVVRARVVRWADIGRFDIRGPGQRTPFMVAFIPWADEARIVLRNGSVRRIRPVQPWHGFTALTYASIRGGTSSDDVVAELNRHLQMVRRTQHSQ
jgi:hypothetical protein